MASESHDHDVNTHPTAGFSNLPLEILDVIFSPLSFTDKRCFRRVCTTWKIALDHPRHYRHITIPASDIPPLKENPRTNSFQRTLASVAPFVEQLTVQASDEGLHPISDRGTNVESVFAVKDIFPQLTQLDLDGGSSRFTSLASCLPRSITQVRFKDFTFVDRLMEPLSLGCIPCSYYNVHVHGSYTMSTPKNDDKERSGLKKELLEVARKFYRPVMYEL